VNQENILDSEHGSLWHGPWLLYFMHAVSAYEVEIGIIRCQLFSNRVDSHKVIAIVYGVRLRLPDDLSHRGYRPVLCQFRERNRARSPPFFNQVSIGFRPGCIALEAKIYRDPGKGD